MTPLWLTWTLLSVSVMTAGSSGSIQVLHREPGRTLYPALGAQESLECGCTNASCHMALWFRTTLLPPPQVSFLGRCNNAEMVKHGPGVDESRFKLSKRGAETFVLRIYRVEAGDAGTYSCVVKYRTGTEEWKPGSLLLPGVTPPTSPPLIKAKPSVKPVCRCPNKRRAPDECDAVVLWPLAGLSAGLGLALIAALYYFNRLPKKCRHFEKLRQKS